jgi:hypothetical protein
VDAVDAGIVESGGLASCANQRYNSGLLPYLARQMRRSG